MTTEELLKVNGIIKYRGKLIFDENGKFYFKGKPYPSLMEAEKAVDKSLLNWTVIDLRE